MNKITYCYHSHTFRCGHAAGEDEEYITTAINVGLKEYGVSDHVILPNIIHPNMRGAYDLLDGYIQSINNLKNKYKDKINIHLGFEAEYMDEYVPYYKDLLESHKIEYLILGQHCYYQNNYPRWYLAMKPNKGLLRYTEHVLKGIESNLFTYVAHPDLFVIFYEVWDDLAIECASKIIDAANAHNMPLEINLCKLRASKEGYMEREFNNIYPYDKFWKLAQEKGAHIIVGQDFHSPKQMLYDNDKYLDEFIKRTGIKVDFNYKIKG